MANKLFLNISSHPEKITDFINVGFSDKFDIKLHDVGNLPFSDDSVSFIRTKNFINDLDRNETLRFFYECRRILAPKGVICLLFKNFCKSIISHVEERNKHTWHEKNFNWYDSWCVHLNSFFYGKKWIYNEQEIENFAKIVGLIIDKNLENKFFGISSDQLVDCKENDQTILFFTKKNRSFLKNPLVSIVMPCSRIKHFEVALLSALNQTYEKIEIVICDNDESGEIYKAIQPYLKDKRIVYIDNHYDIGGYANFLQCFNVARGELIKYLNDDDLLDFRCVEILVNCFINSPDVTFVTSHRQPIDNNGNLLPDIPATKTPVRKSSLIKGITLANAVLESNLNFIGEPTTFIFRKSDLADNYLMPGPFVLEKNMALGDVVIFLFLCLKGDAIYLTDNLSFFRLHENQAQNKIPVEEGIYQWKEVRNAFNNIGFSFKQKTILVKEYPCEADSTWAEENYFDILFGKDTSSDSDLENYHVWFNHHRWSSAAVARLSAEIAVSGATGVHLLLVAESGTGNTLADTADSFNAQSLSNWRITVFSPTACPDSLFEMLPLAWINVTATGLGEALNTAVANSDIDWFLIGIPGLRVEPVFSALICAEVVRHPEWRFIYLDEDRIYNDNHFVEPMLKPDANYDLLLSTCYIGNACLIHREILCLMPTNLLLKPGLILNYAAALRCYEAFGEQAIGHIDEIVFHQLENFSEKLNQFESSGLRLLQEHLKRQGIKGNASLGLIKGSFFVDYQLFRIPLISIIIPTKNRLDLLQPCVESLLEKTRYLNYEVIIMDNCSDDPEVLKYLDYLLSCTQRIKVIPYPKEYNYSAINNLAARQAQGDFLVLLNNDTVILQENWLERLVSIGLRKDVGVVGCRLVFTNQKIQHAGVVVGMRDTADHVGIDLPMSDMGHMGRMQLTQNFSAVTAACLLINKKLFFKVGGLDEIDFPILFNDVDLCLKIRELGYLVVWTPYVTLIHHGSVSLKSNTNTKEQEVRNQKNMKSIKSFHKKWVHYKQHDPAYNRHLSLRQREWMIDGAFNVLWHPDLEPLPRIIAQPPDATGVGQYRMIGPLKALTDSGRICSFLLPPINSEARFLPFPSELARAKPTVLFLQNAFSHWHIGEVESYAELLPDIFRVFGQDDIVFSVPQKSSVHKLFGKDTKARLRKVASLCHRVIVTTQPIADAMRGMVDDIRVIPNYLERSRWGDLQPPRKERRKLRVGWAGAQQHQGDLEFIIPVVEATANEVDWIFMGMSLPKLRYHIAELHGPVSFDEYPAGLAALDLDLAIAPLEINRFNAAKSNLRLLEYGAVGYPVICTDIEPYRNAPVTCVSNNPKAWIDAIHAHIHDMDATRAAGEQLHDWVLSNWMLDQHLDEWMMLLLPD